MRGAGAVDEHGQALALGDRVLVGLHADRGEVHDLIEANEDGPAMLVVELEDGMTEMVECWRQGVLMPVVAGVRLTG